MAFISAFTVKHLGSPGVTVGQGAGSWEGELDKEREIVTNWTWLVLLLGLTSPWTNDNLQNIKAAGSLFHPITRSLIFGQL